MKDKVAKSIQDNVFLGNWHDTDAYYYEVNSMEGLNQLVGYVKFTFPGVILYRGQTQDYDTVSPNGCRSIPVSDETLSIIAKDKKMGTLFCFKTKNKQYKKFLVEAALQHYGGKTFCVDFVDNHWTALWFGVNDLGSDYVYRKREDDGYLHVYMYSTGKLITKSQGIYATKDCLVSDLRRSLPSYFLRPAAQHGWIVRKKKRQKYNLNDHIVCVARIKVKNAVAWLGNGMLLSMNNFFPDYQIDQAYSVLLDRQIRSGYLSKSKATQILPMETIANYHFSKSIYVSDSSSLICPVNKWCRLGKKIDDIISFYQLLLHFGWDQNTSSYSEKWEEKFPCQGQSAPTALLVQTIFGGDILYFQYGNQRHYFNQIGTVFVDLTYQEIDGEYQTRMKESCSISESQQVNLKNKYQAKCRYLMEKIKIDAQ